MSITFTNRTYPAGFVGEDDGAPDTSFGLDNVSTGNIVINGTVAKVGDTVTATGLLAGDSPGDPTTNTLYVTAFDNAGMIQFSDQAPADQSDDTSYRFVLSNTQLSKGMTVNFNNDPALSQYQVACFVAGTLIRVAGDGIETDRAVEDLKVGDLVVTASGRQRPVRWLGKRSYAGRFANRNPGMLPVCFTAGSLGEGLPMRDLWISPKHAMFIDGALVPAEHLVNGASIYQVTRVDRVDYYHVELDSHDVLLAEGSPSESFVDDNSRQIFHNAPDHAALYPDTATTEAVYCAPRLESGHELEMIRCRIDARAEGLRRAR